MTTVPSWARSIASVSSFADAGVDDDRQAELDGQRKLR